MSLISTDTEHGISFEYNERSLSLSLILKLIGLILLISVPVIADSYVYALTIALTYVIFAIGLDLIWGYGGIMSFGHATFFGLGAYITGKALTEGWLPSIDIAVVLIATIVPATLGLLLALLLFYQRIDPLNFAVLTLVLAAISEQAATSLSSITGGSNGIGGIPTLSLNIPGVLQYNLDSIGYYYFALALAVFAYLTAVMILRSRFGTVLISIRENETKTRALGYRVELYKSIAFGISCAFAGFAGSIYAAHVGFVSPSVLGFILSTQAVIWILIGGKGTLIGAFIAPIIMRILESELSQALVFSWQLVVGLILVFIVLVFPGGIVSLYTRLEERIVSSQSRLN